MRKFLHLVSLALGLLLGGFIAIQANSEIVSDRSSMTKIDRQVNEVTVCLKIGQRKSEDCLAHASLEVKEIVMHKLSGVKSNH